MIIDCLNDKIRLFSVDFFFFSNHWTLWFYCFRDTILKLLLDGARELGHIVCAHIRALLNELNTLRRRPDAGAVAGSSSSASAAPSTATDEPADAEAVDKSKGFLLVFTPWTRLTVNRSWDQFLTFFIIIFYFFLMFCFFNVFFSCFFKFCV